MNSSSERFHLNKKARQVIQIIVVIICVAFVAKVTLQRRSESRAEAYIVSDGERTLMNLSRLRGIPLHNLRTGKSEELQDRPRQKLRLLVFLTAADCSTCLSQLPHWDFLSRTTAIKDLDIVLIFVYTSQDEARSFLDAYRLPYDAFLDDRNLIPGAVGIPSKTPVSILVRNDYEVLTASPATNSTDLQRSFEARVQSIAELNAK